MSLAALARLLRLGRRAAPLADRPLAPLAHLPAYPGAHRAAADRPATSSVSPPQKQTSPHLEVKAREFAASK